MSDGKRFPILDQRGSREKDVAFPRDIPWSIIAPHERQALRNHDQSLKELARRGGLAPCEAVAVLEDRRWAPMDDAAAVARLKEIASPRGEEIE